MNLFRNLLGMTNIITRLGQFQNPVKPCIFKHLDPKTPKFKNASNAFKQYLLKIVPIFIMIKSSFAPLNGRETANRLV